MDFSKLDQNEKLAVYGSVAVVLAGLISAYGGLMFLGILAAIGMLIVVFLPQFSTGTSLPGSKGTLMAVLGLVALATALITLLQWLSLLGVLLSAAPLNTIMVLVAIAGAVVMAWAGWQELQREGGQWRFGASSTAGSSTVGGTTATTTATTTDASPTSAPDAAAAAPPTATTAAPPPASPPADMDDRPPASSSLDEDYGTDSDRRSDV